MPHAPFPGYYSFLRIVFMSVGALIAYAVFFGIWKATANFIVALVAFVAVLAFWLGTLSMVFRTNIHL